VANKIGSHKGYVSGIENDKVNPPSVKVIKKYAKLFGQDARTLARLAWVDKAPAILREDAEKFLEWVQADDRTENRTGGPSAPSAPLPENPKET
jgi:transcriptional regulator with XRE-family HTH domain